jgi:hypothetical protein
MLHTRPDNSFGARRVIDWLTEGSLVSLVLRTNTAYRRRMSRSNHTIDSPPAGKLFPILGVELMEGGTFVVLLDKWNWRVSQRSESWTLYKGTPRAIFVNITDLSSLFGVIIVSRYPDLQRLRVSVKNSLPNRAMLWNTMTCIADDAKSWHVFALHIMGVRDSIDITITTSWYNIICIVFMSKLM